MATMLEKSKSWIATRWEKREPRRAWIALAAAVLTNLLLDIIESFGVMFNALVEKYDASIAAVGWIYFIHWMLLTISAFSFGPFIAIYGCRPVAFVTAALFSVSNIFSAFAPNVGVLYLTFGVLMGIADVGLHLSSATIIQQLFSTNRGLATGISAVGFPLGTIVHPFQAKFLLDNYGVSGVYLIHGAVCLHTFMLAFAFRSPRRYLKGMDASRKIPSSPPELRTISDAVNRMAKRSRSQEISQNGEAASRSVTERDVRRANDNRNTQRLVATQEKGEHIFIKDYFRQITDFSPLKDIGFVLSYLHLLLLWTIRLGTASHIVSCAKSRGIVDDKASYLLSISGLSNLVTMILASFVMNSSFINPAVLSSLASTSLVCSSFGCAFSQQYGGFSFSALALGVSDAITMGNMSLLIIYVIGLERFPRGLSLLWTMLLPAPICGSLLTGWLRDSLMSYRVPFIVFGIFGIISSCLALLVAAVTEIKNKTIHDQKSSDNSEYISTQTLDTIL